MLVDLIVVIIVISAVAGGFVCGRIDVTLGNYAEDESFTPTAADTGGPRESGGDAKIASCAAQLRVQAESMAASVDAHQSRMQAVNHSLEEIGEISTEQALEVVRELIASNRSMQKQLSDARDRICEQSMELISAEERALTDPLTQIPNRGALDQFLSRLHAQGRQDGCTLAMLDVDHFKKFNDNFGHTAADEVLRTVAGLLHSRLNQFGLVARYGGEEFAVVFDGTAPADVERLIEETRIAISQRITEFENKRLRVTASIGVASLGVDDSLQQWVQRADSALYHAKSAGRNCAYWMERTQPRKIKPLAGPDQNGEQSDTSPALPDAFSVIPNQDQLGQALRQIRDRMHSEVPVYVLAIRHHGGDNDAAMKRLLPAVRATLRSVDRIGYADASTLLICMMSVVEATAIDRGTQICKSAATLGLMSQAEAQKTITVGITPTVADEHFGYTAARAIELSDQAKDAEWPPIAVKSMATAEA